MKAIATTLAVLCLALGGLSLFRVRTPAGAALLTRRWSPQPWHHTYVALTELIGATLGLVRRSPLAVAAGGAEVMLAGNSVHRVAAPHRGFECGVIAGAFLGAVVVGLQMAQKGVDKDGVSLT